MKISSRLLLIATLILLSQTAGAQNQPAEHRQTSFRPGDQTLTLGIGLGVRYGYVPNTAIAPAMILVYDVGVGEGFAGGTFGLGAVVAVKSARYEPIPFYAGPAYRARWNNYLVAARVSHHFALSDGFENLDLYAGMMAGFRYELYRQTAVSGAGGSIALLEETHRALQPVIGVFGGGCYHFTPKIGVCLEVGYDVSLIKTGVHFIF